MNLDDALLTPDTNGAELLDDLHHALTKYVVLPSREAADAITLWTAATHALQAFQHAPRLAIKSPEKRCGKSRLLDIINGTCHKPLMSVNATVAAIFRSLGGDHPPTLLVDEADTLFGTKKMAEQNEDFRALLNAGHQRDRGALRCVGPLQTPTDFPTFAMAALAGIGDLPDTITDRAVNVTMRRRRNDEPVAQFRTRRDGPELTALRDRLAAWSTGAIPTLQDAEPDMPVEDRAADTWEPLVAIADLMGGAWPERARLACKVLTAEADEADEEGDLDLRLLADIRTIVEQRKVSFIASADLIAALKRVDESPWGDWDFTARRLAVKLSKYKIKPQRNAAGTARGYRLEDLRDPFRRYLRPNPSEPSEPSNTEADLHRRLDGSKPSDGSTRQTVSSVRDKPAGQPPNLTVLTVLTDTPAQTAPNRCGHTGKTTPNGRCFECVVAGVYSNQGQ